MTSHEEDPLRRCADGGTDCGPRGRHPARRHPHHRHGQRAGIDFFTDGSVLVYGNTDTGSLPGSYILDFSFSGLSGAINSFTLGDLSAVTGGTISAGVLNATTIRLSFTDLTLTDSFATFSAQIGLAAAVPEPSSWAMLSDAGPKAAGLQPAACTPSDREPRMNTQRLIALLGFSLNASAAIDVAQQTAPADGWGAGTVGGAAAAADQI